MRRLRFLIDADMPRSSAHALRSLGYDVEDVRDVALGAAKDIEIIEYALTNRRIIVTRDTDFSESLRYPRHPGAIILRLPHTYTSKQINERLLSFMTSITENDLINAIVVVQLSRYRVRKIG
jgi:predicted nuclease of predicted toxin-antitoxin system